ncbi:AAA family ATPase, partial [Myxococcota bacterium]|nr:AAA family ATPase [Myxococcota bacterium]
MRIKSLDIFGFKSFAEKAHFSFGTGITGIVGPNGCGKSNVIDAIKWCMGEMSAKSLRGRSMQDIIFNGSEHRGPMGMAEVTITFSNDGNVPPQFVDYEDISVTRRLHRDGRSEYLINKTPVRLRDITDLFLGTGVGTRAYSIIEQGRIGYVVNARPEDRRGLIEEVAGITKFKARKKAAERRLDATQQNLLRVNDIITELERQLNSLRRQAKKAERYKKLRDEQRGLELHAAAAEILRIATVEKVQKAEYDVLQGRLSDAQVGVATEETRLESDRLGMIEEEERLQVEQQKSAEIDARMAALERDLTHWRTQLEELTMRAHEGASEVESAKSRVAQAESEKHEFKILIEALNSQSQDDRERIGR